MRRIFLIGMLCGVIITAAAAYVFAIPANSDHWRMEIWKRGGAAWTFDKDGKISWKWTVKAVSDSRAKKAVVAPRVNGRTTLL